MRGQGMECGGGRGLRTNGFRDDILLLANLRSPEPTQMLDPFVKAVGHVGLRFNVDKQAILTNEAKTIKHGTDKGWSHPETCKWLKYVNVCVSTLTRFRGVYPVQEQIILFVRIYRSIVTSIKHWLVGVMTFPHTSCWNETTVVLGQCGTIELCSHFKAQGNNNS